MKMLFNHSCSKCRIASDYLQEQNIEFTKIDYNSTPLSRAEILDLLEKLGPEAQEIVRTKEKRYIENPFALEDKELVATNLAKYPELMQRPIIFEGDRAWIARSQETLEKAASWSKCVLLPAKNLK